MKSSSLIGCHIDPLVADDLASAFPDRVEHHVKGKLLVCQGDETEGVYYLLLKGEVKVSFISAEGKDFAHFICVAPSAFGESAFISNTREFFAEALTDVTLLSLSVAEVFPSCELERRLLREMVKLCCTKDFIKRKITQPYRSASLKQILVNIMKDLCNAHDSHSKRMNRSGRLCVELNLTQQGLAEFAQASRINVHKALAELAEDGVIDVEKRKIYYYLSEEQ
ncbi:MAG: Crp/Fnr family transcriptional regulator [Oscillospiraceae bacterium]|nr:Crp/Fnr family transcriptional regulator [Oscillospiraceae bacterium]